MYIKAHELLNVLNHVDPQSDWDGGDLFRLPDGSIVSIAESAKTMRPGESRLMPPLENVPSETDPVPPFESQDASQHDGTPPTI